MADISEIKVSSWFGGTSSAKIVGTQLVIEKSGRITNVAIDDLLWVRRLEFGSDPSGAPQYVVELRNGSSVHLPAAREARAFVISLCRKAGIEERFLADEARKRRIEVVMIVLIFTASGIGCTLYLLLR